MLYGSEAWCPKESVMKILRMAERLIVRAMCGVHLKDTKRSMNLMLMLDLNETMYHLLMACSVCWYGHVLRREDGHILRCAFILRLKEEREAEEDMEESG